MGHERAKSIQAVSGLAEQSTAKENLRAQRGWLTTSRKLIYFIASRAAQRERLDLVSMRAFTRERSFTG